MFSLRKVFLASTFVLSAFILSYAADSIVLTTYYPSPYGVYNEMRSKRMAIGDTYYDTATFPWEEADGDGGKIDYLADLVVEGNVGIGTTEPGGNLDVAVSDTATTLAATVDQYAIRLLNTDTTNNNWVLMTFDDASNNNPVAAFGARITDHSNNYGDLGFATRSSAGWAEKMRILANGNIGIGTTNPTSTFYTTNPTVLDINSSSGYSGIVLRSGGDSSIMSMGAASSGLKFSTESTNLTQMFIGMNGNVGIGTTAPDQRLTVVAPNNSNGAAVFKGVYSNVFGILPYSGVTYLSSGLYYKDGTWTQANDNSNNQLFGLSPR